MIKSFINQFTENTYIINEKKEVLIIDPGAHQDEIITYIKKNKFHVQAILLTHGHFDHIVSLNELIKEYDVDVYIHESERDFLFDPNLNLSSQTLKRFQIKQKNHVKTFTDTDEFTLGDIVIRILHTPGHTRGSCCFVYGSAIFSGDTLFKGTIGRTDLPTSSSVSMEKSLKKLMNELDDNTLVYPGHGHFTTIFNERIDNPYID